MILTLTRLRKKESFLSDYTNGMSYLFQSGIFDFLKDKARPRIINDGSDANSMAAQAARSAGYFEALEDLFYFRELYLEQGQAAEQVPMEFGGLDKAVNLGDLEELEKDAIRRNEPVDYESARKRFIDATLKTGTSTAAGTTEPASA